METNPMQTTVTSPESVLAEVAGHRDAAQRLRALKSVEDANHQLSRITGWYTAPGEQFRYDRVAGTASVRAAYVERDELLRFVRLLIADTIWDGRDCEVPRAECPHDAAEAHEWSVRDGESTDIIMGIWDRATELLDELGLSRAARK